MASMTITIPDAVATRVTEALAAKGGWTADMGVTKPAFAKTVVVQWIKSVVVLYEADAAGATARANAMNTADSDISLS